jgi:DNA repair protein RAD50
MVAARRLQLTVKKNTRSQKTLDGSLVIHKDGEKTSISTRVAELDQLIPQYLGVSKAILEFVIFCHQDDSLWPMSEPSVLKKRFDEIFEALKYTKVVENIKILRKKQNEDLGKLKLTEQYAKESKTKGDESEKKQTKLFDEIEVLRGEAEQLDAKVDEAHEEAQKAFNHAAKFEHIVAQLNGKRITLKANQDSAKDLEINLVQMPESDEELQAMLDQHEERISKYGEQQQELMQQYNEHKHNIEDNRRSLGTKQGEIGKFQAEKEQYERQLQKRENLIKEAAKRHSVRGFDYDISDTQIVEFLKIIGKMSREQDRFVTRARDEIQTELREAQAQVSSLNERKSALVQSREMSRSQISANDKRISELRKSVDQIHVDEGGEATLKEKKADTEKSLSTAISESETERFDDRIKDADAAAHTLEDKKSRLDDELFEATKLARDSAQIDFAQDELKKAQKGLQTMKEIHGGRISSLVDPEWEPASLEAAFKGATSQKSSDVKDAESRRDIAQSNLANINFKMNNIESEQKKKRAQVQTFEKVVMDAIQKDDISDFEENLKELEEQYEVTSGDQAKFQATIDYMEGCLQTAEEHNECRLCRRMLRDNKAEQFTKAGFLARLEQLIEKAKTSMGGADNAEELFSELETVRNAKPSYEQAMRLRNDELPTLQSEYAKLSSEREVINKQLEDHDAIVDDLRSSKQDVDSLSSDIQSIVNYYKSICDIEEKIRDLTQKQKAAGLSRGIDAVQEDVKKISEQARTAKATLTGLTTGRDKLRTRINTLQFRIRDIDAELNIAQSKLNEKRALNERIEDFKTQNNEKREAIREIDQQIAGLAPQIEQGQGKYEDINRRGNERMQHLQQDASKLTETVRQLSEADQDINAYIDKGGPTQLEKVQREIKNLDMNIASIEEEQIAVTKQLKKIQDTVHDTESTKRSIGDNIRYRKAKRSLQSLEAEIQELQSHNAEADKELYERRGQKWQNEWTKYTTERASLYATIRTKDDTLNELIQEWETEYKDAALNYRKAHIKVETTKAAADDLGVYASALDKAIMKYHTLKMEEINQIIEELWKHAYQGTDVDTIRIRSDSETAKNNRSYNYRVVMVKQDTEMDMRGRCSAGQKVLASIVIRLALAECFGKDCGLIALDEPTTNLDQQNIKGLAESLSEIIKARRKQANFQLIVITHDEQFLREMNCADYADVYWRVGRNEQQTSVIEMQNINEVSILIGCE